MNVKKIFYDFEVFMHDFMVVFIDYDTKEKTVIVNDTEMLKEFYETHKEDIFIGFNSRQYDQYIFKGLLLGMNPYFVSKQLIEDDKKGWQIIKNSKDYPLNNYDISKGFLGLKQLEAFLGSKIKETSVSFDINRSLTAEEIQETIEYCTHDVEQTIEVFDKSREEFDSQVSLIEAFNLNMNLFNKTKAQLAAEILNAVKQPHYHDEFDFNIPHNLKLYDKYQYIVDWFKNPLNANYSCNLKTNIANVPHIVAFGGLHGSVDNFHHEGLILCCDVALTQWGN